jgi:hypothetical protein
VPQRTLQLLDRLERAGEIGRVEHRCGLQFHQLFAEVALAPLPPEDSRRGDELGVLGAISSAAAEHLAAVNHIVETLDRLAAIDPRYPQMAWSTLGLGRPLHEAGVSGAMMVGLLVALRRVYRL